MKGAKNALQVALSLVPADGANNTARTETLARGDWNGLGQDPIPGGAARSIYVLVNVKDR